MRASIIGEELIQAGREEGVANGREEGIAKGREEGKEIGRAETVRHLQHHIRKLIAARLAGTPVPPWLDSVADIDRLEAIFDSLLHARGEEQARAVLEKAG